MTFGFDLDDWQLWVVAALVVVLVLCGYRLWRVRPSLVEEGQAESSKAAQDLPPDDRM